MSSLHPFANNTANVDKHLLHFWKNNKLCSGQIVTWGKIWNFTSFLNICEKQLESIDASKVTALDGLSARFLRISSGVIEYLLTKIVNLSITKGFFLDSFKKAKINPCFKTGTGQFLSFLYCKQYWKTCGGKPPEISFWAQLFKADGVVS